VINLQNRNVREEYIRMTTRPMNAAEWTLAITNPFSPIYDMVMTVVGYILLEQFVLRLVAREYLQHERQEIIDRLAYAECLERREQEALRAAPPADKQIADLEATQTELKESIMQIDIYLEAISNNWHQQQEQQANNFMAEPALQHLNDAQKDKVKAAFHLISPVKILQANPALLNRSLPTLAEDLMMRFGMARELNVLSNVLLEGEFNPSDFLKALKTGPKINVPRCTPGDKKIIQEAITGVCKKKADQKSLAEVNQALQAMRHLPLPLAGEGRGEGPGRSPHPSLRATFSR